MDLHVADDAALVTASSSGLGLASAVALAREGANVAICGRDEARLADAREAVDDAGPGEVLARAADVTDPDQVGALVEATADAFGGVDHVVTSAGGVPSGPFLETTDRDWYEAYDVLVMSHVWTLRAAHPHLAASDAGSVVAITSTSVAQAIEGLVLSNAVRRAVLGVVETAALEWAPGVRVNAVLPGTHETARLRELVDQGIERGEYADVEEGLADWSADVAMDRPGDPAELGDAVAFLSSPRASFVTGASLPVDGGTIRG